ncbi:MAG: DUF1631 family protein [Chromatiales bacterium]|jgi:hypothetical protein
MATNSWSDKSISPNFRKILSPWKDESVSFLVDNLREMFKSADQVLLEFADKAQNNKIQTYFFEAMRELWLKQDNVVAIFQDGLERNIFRFRDTSKETASVTETLSLVSKDTFEKNLALETIANQAEKKNYSTLYELTQRLAIVNNGHAISMHDIPASPKQLAEIFEKCAEVIFIEKEVRLVLYTLFDRFVISKATKIYKDLNQRLVDADILPDLKPQFLQQENRPERNTDEEDVEEITITEAGASVSQSRPKPAASSSPTDTESETPQYRDNASSSEIAEETFDRIKDLLAVQRAKKIAERKSRQQASGGTSTGGGQQRPVSMAKRSEISETITSPEITDSIPLPETGVRQDAVKRVEVDAQLIVNINETLKKQRELIKKLVGQERFPAEDEDVIDIVGLIFEMMLNDNQLSNEVKTLLSHLHTPYLKIAVEDPTFLTEHEHPARRLFDLMIATGRDWVDPSDLTKGIYPQIQMTVNRILADKRYDQQAFNKLAMELTEANALLSNKQKINEDRTVEVEKGRAKLNQAKQIAQQQTQQLLQDKVIIKDASEFLAGPWIDYLTLVLLRSDFNQKSDSWQQALALCEKIVQYSLSSKDPNGAMPSRLAIQDLSNELNEVVGSLIPHYQAEIDSFLKALSDSSKRDSFVESKKPEESAAATEQPGQNKEIDEQIEKLRSVTPGTMFILIPDGTETKMKVKLSWYNPVTANFLFINQSGVKAAVKNIRQLASEIVNGQAQMYEKSNIPFIDKSFRAIRALLEKSTN